MAGKLADNKGLPKVEKITGKNLRVRLAAEGHRVVKKGNRYVVADYERVAMKPTVS